MERQITESHIDAAIDAAEVGQLGEIQYNQGSWCGTACCVLGFAREIAGIEGVDRGPREGEIVNTPRAKTIEKLMKCGGSSILKIMRAVRDDGSIDLRDADLHGADLRGAYLRDAYLRGADLHDADLHDADLRDADLRGADLHGADLRGADLRGAYLRDAYLHGADLRDADLRGADLHGAYLHGAYLHGANLRDAITDMLAN